MCMWTFRIRNTKDTSMIYSKVIKFPKFHTIIIHRVKHLGWRGKKNVAPCNEYIIWSISLIYVDIYVCLHISVYLLIHLNTHTDTQIGIYFNQGILIIVNQVHFFLWNVVSIWRIPQTTSGETIQDQNFKGFILGSNFIMFSETILVFTLSSKV